MTQSPQPGTRPGAAPPERTTAPARPPAGGLPGLTLAAAAWPGALIIALGLLYVALHFPDLDRESFWTDELVSVGSATHDVVRMLKIQAGDIHPPLHAFVLWLLMRVTGDASEATLRLPSLLAAATGITVLSLAAWRRIGQGGAVLVMALGIASPLVAGFAAQARPHAMTFGFVCLATAAWLHVLRAGSIRKRGLVAFAATGLLASLSQHYGALAFGLEAAVALGWLAVRARRREGIDWAGVRLASGVIALSLAPVVAWLAVTRQWLRASSTPPLTLAWGELVARWAAEPFSLAFLGPAGEAPRAIWVVVGVIGVALLLLAGASVRLRSTPSSRRPAADTGRLAIGAAAIALVLLAAMVAVGQSLVGSPTLHFRSILSLMPLLYMGLGVAFTVPFGRLAPAAGLALAVAVAAVAIRTPQLSLYGPLDQWREAAAVVRDQQRAGLPGYRIALVEQFEPDDWIVSLGNAYGVRAPTESLPSELAGLHWVKSSADIGAVPAGSPLLLVAFHYYQSGVHEAIVAATRERFGPCQDLSVIGITILRCAPPGSG